MFTATLTFGSVIGLRALEFALVAIARLDNACPEFLSTLGRILGLSTFRRDEGSRDGH